MGAPLSETQRTEYQNQPLMGNFETFSSCPRLDSRYNSPIFVVMRSLTQSILVCYSFSFRTVSNLEHRDHKISCSRWSVRNDKRGGASNNAIHEILYYLWWRLKSKAELPLHFDYFCAEIIEAKIRIIVVLFRFYYYYPSCSFSQVSSVGFSYDDVGTDGCAFLGYIRLSYSSLEGSDQLIDSFGWMISLRFLRWWRSFSVSAVILYANHFH